MPLSALINSILCIFACLVLSGCSQNNASNKQALAQDASAFCDIHEAKHWNDISPQIPITEFNKISYERVSKVLKTNEFNKLLDEMGSVEFYRQMYPPAKSRIEKLTGEAWNCPAYENFYSIKTSSGSTDSHESEADIIITKEGKYLIQNKPVKLTPNALKAALDHEKNPKSNLIIKMETGASDNLLPALFQAIAPLGIEDVSVLSED